MSDEERSANEGRGTGDLEPLIRQFAARIERLERELKELRAQLEANRPSQRAAGSGTA
jgi:uncharacterized protein (UPF0335 family)